MINREDDIRLAVEAGAQVCADTITFNGKDCDEFVTRLIALAKNTAYRDAAKIAYHEQVGCLNDGEECCAESAGCIHVAILAKMEPEDKEAAPLTSDSLIEQLSEALRHSVNQLSKWQDAYGKWNPEWLPPAGDVQVAEIADDAMSAAREYFAKK